MDILRLFDAPPQLLVAAAARVRALLHVPDEDVASLFQGAERAVQEYSRASEAYTGGIVSPSVALWSLLVAAGFVLLEWVVARRGRL